MSCDHSKDNLAILGKKKISKLITLFFPSLKEKSKTCQLANIPQERKNSFTSSWQGVEVNVKH